MCGERTSTGFLTGGGEMGELTRSFDWSATPLGPPESWPQSLKITVRLVLNSRHPMLIWWGPELIQFYNDAYAATLGPERHPGALGARGRDCWAESWPIIGPQIDFVMRGQGSTWNEDRLVPVTRHGKRESVWWTYSYEPIDVEGEVGGVLVICNDVTVPHRAFDALRNQTQRLEQLFEQAPGFMVVLRGPDHVLELTNAAYRRLLGKRDFVGKTVREVVPEAEAQGFIALLDEVYRTGTTYVGKRVPFTRHSPGRPPQELVLDFVYQPIVEADGAVSGIFVEGADVTERVRNEEHLQLMNEELKHRVKNTLAVVGAIASQTLRGPSRDAALTKFHGRLAAFAKAHDTLTDKARATASVFDVVDGALAPHRTAGERILMSGRDIKIGSKQALSLALAVHELATNAAKYGALSNDSGQIRVRWWTERKDGKMLFRFSWQESGGPAVTKPSRQGFGSKLIERVLTADCGGDVAIVYAASGLICDLTAPLDNFQSLRSQTSGSV